MKHTRNNRKTKTEIDHIEVANKLHRKVSLHVRDALGEARAAGEALCRAKGMLKKKGTKDVPGWHAWLKEHFHGSVRTAQVYMRIHMGWDRIEEKVSDNSELSINKALVLLKTRESKFEKKARIKREMVIDRTPVDEMSSTQKCACYETCLKRLSESLKRELRSWDPVLVLRLYKTPHFVKGPLYQLKARLEEIDEDCREEYARDNPDAA